MSLLIDEDIRARVGRLELSFNPWGYDAYGASERELALFYTQLARLYRRYFRVRARGAEHVPDRGRAMLVGNHSGGWALDALMLLTACIVEKEPPRLAHGMAEKFLGRLPVSAWLIQRLGQVIGLPANALRLLEDDRLLMVFPEGARGTEKLYWQRNDLVDFGSGFLRLALAAKAPIVPCGIAGGGEAVPTVKNLYGLGKALGVPYVPVTPWGLALPIPARMAIVFGEPMTFEGTGNEEDAVIDEKVALVKARVRELTDEAIALRAGGAS